ncbi:hypothetical protein Naga_100564g4 [Nannochloropsis gaditana]|uniref:Uncharacterized protein n=1 Tax=Nannochloropsis gaditana TaxID=72520 RepID=W7T3P4_9STRA|nr:hypothetical protein Naga_100564g4 [Nannochloropsis gaditana]
MCGIRKPFGAFAGRDRLINTSAHVLQISELPGFPFVGSLLLRHSSSFASSTPSWLISFTYPLQLTCHR